MTFRRRFKLSEQQRTDMWRRWKAGQSLHEIGRAFSKDHVSIQFMLAQQGGIAPAARRRSPLTLTLAERENISRGIACGSSIRDIAKGLERAASTVNLKLSEAIPNFAPNRSPVQVSTERCQATTMQVNELPSEVLPN